MKKLLLTFLLISLFPLTANADFVTTVKEFFGVRDKPVSTSTVQTKDITPPSKKEKTEGGINLKQVNKQTVTTEVKTGDVNVKQADVNVKGGDVSFKTETKLENTITNWKDLVSLLAPLLKTDPKYDSLTLDISELRDRILSLENATSTFIINIPKLDQPNVYVSSPSVSYNSQIGTTTVNFNPIINTPTSTINFSPTIENGTSTIIFSPIITATSSDIINITATSSIDSVTQQLLDIININTQLNATNTVALQNNILTITGVVGTLQTDLTTLQTNLTTLTNDYMSFKSQTATTAPTWTSYTSTVTAPTSNPVLPTSAIKNASYIVQDKTLFINFQLSYSAQAGGSNGTGIYNFSIPAGYTIDTAKAIIPSLTGTAADSGYDGTQIGTYQISNGGTNYVGKVVALTSTTVGLFGTTLSGTQRGLRGSTSGSMMENTAPTTYSFVAQIPIN
jgi:hypothetical protein